MEKVVSGGQTGVDRAALDVALELGIPCGGWCPRGRLAEDGPLDRRYPLSETPATDNAVRTEWNVRDSDATLILDRGPLEGGTRLTGRIAERLRRPSRVVDLDTATGIEGIAVWIEAQGIEVLNLAGPRESGRPGIQADAMAYLRRLLGRLAAVTSP